MAGSGQAGVDAAGQKLISTAQNGVLNQRSKGGVQHQPVPPGATAQAAPAVKGGAPPVTGRNMTVAGRGLLTRGGQKGPPS